MEYGFTMDLPDGWVEERAGAYSNASPWARLTTSSQYLSIGYTVGQFASLVHDDLRKDWWPAASLFEITSVEEAEVGSQPARRIRYRVQESPQYCVVNVEELVVVSQLLPGNPQGFRVKAWMCQHDVESYGQVRKRILDSFQISTKPPEYYRQFMSVDGVTVKANGSVDPAAVEAGAEIVAAMLSGRQDIVRCMARTGAELAIIPNDQTLTSLPDYKYMTGTRDFTGRSRDTFELRGVGGVRGIPVSSAAEEQVLGTMGPQHPYYSYRGLVAVHEFGHGIQNLCFTQEDHEVWNGFYQAAVQAGLYPDTHMMANVNEFFAVFTTGYFEVTDELGRDSSRDDLKARFPDVFLALDGIYGGAALPEIYTTRLERQQ